MRFDESDNSASVYATALHVDHGEETKNQSYRIYSQCIGKMPCIDITDVIIGET